MKRPVGTIAEDTPILPFVIADNVVRELGAYLYREHAIELDAPEALVKKLTSRAKAFYQANERWRKKVRRNPTFGRDWLYTYMRHWLASEKRDLLYAGKIPWTFANGEALR